MEFEFTVRPATAMERQFLAREQIDSDLGSDACVLILAGREIVGWGNDYGTVELVPLSGVPYADFVAHKAEQLISAATKFYEALNG